MVSTMKDQGYRTVAMHPYPGENWNRNACYANMGFDEFLDGEYFKGCLLYTSMDVMPDSMTVGSESNVMFGINNTGKVVLYNVTVNFEADSIKPTDYYVGNIKPGETGNVDTMLSGVAATADDGTVRVVINYEDENGQPAAPVEKELTLLVEEDVQEDWNMDMPEDVDASGQAASEANNKLLLAGGGAVLVAVIAAAVFTAVSYTHLDVYKRQG